MGDDDPVLAVVDSANGSAVVWWVDLGVRRPGMSRLAGAWVTAGADARRHVPALVAGRLLLPTPAGAALLDELGVPVTVVVDPDATRAAVVGERDRLGAACRARRGARPPEWPHVPDPLDLEATVAAGPAADPAVARALAAARWFDVLCMTWDGVEGRRLARTWLRDADGPRARLLPVVLAPARTPVPG